MAMMFLQVIKSILNSRTNYSDFVFCIPSIHQTLIFFVFLPFMADVFKKFEKDDGFVCMAGNHPRPLLVCLISIVLPSVCTLEKIFSRRPRSSVPSFLEKNELVINSTING